jgi:hypothetical protein
MPRPTQPCLVRPSTLSAVVLVLASILAVAACGPVAASPTPDPTAPAPTDAGAACPTGPTPAPASLEGWDVTGQRPTLFPVVVSSRLTCGENRFLFSFLDADNRPAATPDRTVSLAFYDLGRDGDRPVRTTTGAFIWAIEGSRGLYAATADFATAGMWGVEFTTVAPGAASETIRVLFQVADSSPVVAIGASAPASDTPTLADVEGEIGRLSTDPDPIEAFYETSVADALAEARPFVLVFATPKFCTSAQCGPTLDRLKPIAAAHPAITFINVEPFDLEFVDGQLQPVLTNGQLTPAAATLEWGLLSEPWIFVVDGNGIVRGSFEAVVGEEELETVLRRIAPGT